MWNVGLRAKRVLLNPGAFALAVIKSFRANQGVLLAGAVAYYTLLSLVPVLIIVLIARSHFGCGTVTRPGLVACLNWTWLPV